MLDKTHLLLLVVFGLFLGASAANASVELFVDEFNTPGPFDPLEHGWTGYVGWESAVIDNDGLEIIYPPDEPGSRRLERLLQGNGSFVTRFEFSEFDLGVAGPRLDAATRFHFSHVLDVDGDTAGFGVNFVHLGDSLEEGYRLVVGSPSMRNFATQVPRSTGPAYIEVSFDRAGQEFSLTYEPDVRDAIAPLVFGPFAYKRDVSDWQWLFVNFENVASHDVPYRVVLSSVSVTPASGLLGDFDGDGTLGVSDVDRLMTFFRKGVSAADVNGDRVVDSRDVAFWIYDLKSTYFGDANLDGEFASSDLILVFESGEYEDRITGNSTWSTGDWNGDGDFTTSDLVVAFQDGGYEQGPREAVSSVPEPSGILSLLIGGMLCLARSRR
ncbi:MAG: PEP-CTERM sorting domain-containing protein [Planctomycetales bacterium]|nr:PEP-CTERM sorting domain-containing protein [Planctomycetales bacterium]